MSLTLPFRSHACRLVPPPPVHSSISISIRFLHFSLSKAFSTYNQIDFSPGFVPVGAAVCFMLPPFGAAEATDGFRTPEETRQNNALKKNSHTAVKYCLCKHFQVKMRPATHACSSVTQQTYHLTSGRTNSHSGSSHSSD